MDFLKHFQKEIAKRGLTENTIKSYSTYISRYLDYVKYTLRKYPSQVTYNDQRKFLDVIQNERNLSDRTMNCVIAQLRFFTMYVLHKPWDPTQLPVRKFDTYLPFVPTQNEVKTFISTMTDIKQKAMVVVMYSAGLRISEVCHLRYEDISRTNMRIHIRHGKNRSDRYAILSKYALDVLTVYWLKCGRPMGWLFPKQRDSSEPIDTYFLLRHIEEHEKELGWPKRLTCHSFRHAFGTHLYENGTDLETIRVLMGHKSLSSTFLSNLKELYSNGRLVFPASCSRSESPDGWQTFISHLYDIKWCPYIKETFNGFGNAIEYLGRYADRIAISNNRMKSANLKLIFRIQGKQKYKSHLAEMTMPQIMKQLFHKDICQCPACGKSSLQFLGTSRISTG